MSDLTPSSAAIEVGLEKGLSSTAFRGRPRLRRLLTHLVQYSLAENGDPLKEYTLGVEVFDRGIRFDPQCDAIVRVEAFNLRKALCAYYRSEGATDLVTISVPKGGYRATFRVNEKPPAAILDDPERLCCHVEWSLLRGSAHDIARIQGYVQHAIVRWPGRSDLHVALASTALAALELEGASPVDEIGVMRQAAHAALQCDATRGDAEFYATVHRIMGGHKEASIAGAHHWLDFAPKSALAHFWVGAAVAATGRMGDAVVYLQQAARLQPYATFFETWLAVGLFCTGRTDAGLRHLRAILAFEPQDYLANYWLGLLASHARRLDEGREAASHAYQVSGSPQALAACGNVEAAPESVESAEAILYSLAHSDNGIRRALRYLPDPRRAGASRSRRWRVDLGSDRRRLGAGLGSARPALECPAGKGPGHLTVKGSEVQSRCGSGLIASNGRSASTSIYHPRPTAFDLRRRNAMRMKMVFAWMLGLLVATASAQTAPDATGTKPGVKVGSFEYYIPGILDTDVAPIPIDLWARVYIPSGYSGRLPLVVLLHGNHATCGTDNGFGPARRDDNIQYTLTGTCPDRYIVIPNHAGYDYLARPLATWGYIVVSINANRGVTAAPGELTDRGLNLRRGRLVLRHLKHIVQLDTSASSPLYQRIDFSHVGLMGHSRGGEGMRAAYEQYRAPGSPWPARIGAPIGFEALFEIGPVDGQTGPRTNPNRLNADGLAWTVLLPNCDGDVFNVQGVKPFDRMMLLTNESPARFKATYTVWGTNHNFYNTEWQFSDSPGCLGQTRLFPRLLGSADQRAASSASFLAFMRGNIGPNSDPAFNQNFDPEFALPAVVSNVTRVDRGFTDSPSATITKVFDDFPTVPTNTYASHGVQFALGPVSQHDASQRAAAVSWTNAGPNVLFQSNAPLPVDLSAHRTLEFRVSRQCHDVRCHNAGPDSHNTTNFSVQLVTGAGQLSFPVQLQDYLSLTGPVGSLTEFAGTLAHPILMTARIPLSAFGGADLSQVRAVRFAFDDTRSDAIHIANIRASSAGAGTSFVAPAALPTDDTPLAWDTGIDQNAVSSLTVIPSAAVLRNQPGVEITLNSNRPFLPAGEILVLRIGDQEFDISRYSDDGSTNQVTFVLTQSEFASLKQGDQISVQYGQGDNGNGWRFGGIDKNMLK